MQPFLKWAGGKEKELGYIVPALPEDYDDYYEPFVGGGSVFAAVGGRHSYINDLSDELTSFYGAVARHDNEFFGYARMIDRAWSEADRFFDGSPELGRIYQACRSGEIDDKELAGRISAFCRARRHDILAVLDEPLALDPDAFIREFERNVKGKMSRTRRLEQKKHALPDSDVRDNLRTAVKSSLYMYLRRLYNDRRPGAVDPQLRVALFLFIRNYCYSGMFRYNNAGDFNVPYGGIAYNSKTMSRKLDYYESSEVMRRMATTEVCNLDFEEFFRQHEPQPRDFVFLDPPYDSEFSTYARNEFSRDDHRRLANYLLNRCAARWMLVIKHTDFIYGLYNQPGINIRRFDKEYLVSFMNRNDKSAVHLLITNY